MDGLSVKSITTSRGFVYRYYASTQKRGGAHLPTLLFMHGFRDTGLCWKFMVPYLIELPYRLIMPDLLGHGGTSKPMDPAAYAYHLMGQDMMDILDAEGVEKAIPVGHDHGGGLAQRIYNHFPDRTAALALMNVAYSPPNKKEIFNLPSINAMSTALVGYPIAEYWNFLVAPDAADIMNANLDRVWEIPHANTFEEMKSVYNVPNAMRAYLTNPSVPSINVKPYARDPKLKAEWRAELEKGGLAAPLCWYKAQVEGVQFESDKMVAEENMQVNVPHLFIGCGGDSPCRPELIRFPKEAGLLPDVTEHLLQHVGHWPMYEEPEQTAKFLADFLQEKICAKT